MLMFRYYGDDEDLRHFDGEKLWVPVGVLGKQEVFRAYGIGLSAPNGYFGENWDAFNDCLLDLDWIKTPDVFIVHRDLPQLSQEDTVVYLEILRDAVETWADAKTSELHRRYPDLVPHRLTVYFPKALESTVLSLLGRESSHSSSGA